MCVSCYRGRFCMKDYTKTVLYHNPEQMYKSINTPGVQVKRIQILSVSVFSFV